MPSAQGSLFTWPRGPFLSCRYHEWLPAVTDAVRASDGWDFYHYGNVPRAEGVPPSWRTFDHRPRFNNNYVGLRNRIGISSEAYAYAPFEERVAATLRFVEESLAFAHERAGRIAAVIEEADATPVAGRPLATRAVPRRSPEPVEILLGRTEEVPHPATGGPMRRRLDVAEPTPMDEYVAFEAAEDGLETAPESYYVPADLAAVVDLLAAHGIDGVPLDSDTMVRVEQFVISDTALAERPFEGHRLRTVEGAWTAVEQTLPTGTLTVPVTPVAGRLVFALLEPRSDDGVVAWNLLDDQIETEAIYPILRTPSATPQPQKD